MVRCANCERCTWNPGSDCGIRQHSHCERCGHCIGRHGLVGDGVTDNSPILEAMLDHLDEGNRRG